MTSELFRMDHNDLTPRRAWLGYQNSAAFASPDAGRHAAWRTVLEKLCNAHPATNDQEA